MSEIKVSVAADTRNTASEIRKGVTEPLEEVVDKFSEVARESARAADQIGDKLGDEVKDGVKEAKRETEKLEDAFDQVRKAAKQAGDAGSKIGDDVRRGTREASEGLDELKDESADTAREAAASFDGSADSIADMFQEVAANAFVGFGPAGMAAGLAAAAGLGLALAGLQSAADKANEAGEAVSDLAAEILDAGGALDDVDLGARITDWALEIADSREWWELWQARAKSNLDVVQEAAERTGVSVSDMLAAMSGTDATRASQVLGTLDQQIAALEETQRAAQAAAQQGSSSYIVVPTDPELQKLYDYRQAIQEATGITDAAVAAAGSLGAALAELGLSEEEATAAVEARAAAVASLDDAAQDAMGAWDQYKDKESGALDPSAFIEAMNQRTAAITAYSDNISWLSENVSPETLSAVLAEGLDFAPMLEAIRAGGPEMAAALEAAYSGAAAAASTAAGALPAPVVPKPVTTPADPPVVPPIPAPVVPPPVQTPIPAPVVPPPIVSPPGSGNPLEQWLSGLGSITPSINVTADPSAAQGNLSAFVDQANTTTATPSVAADISQTWASFTAWQQTADSTTTTPSVDANTGPADDRVASWLARPREAVIVANVHNGSLWEAQSQLDALTYTRYARVIVTVDQVQGSRVI